MSFLLGLLVTVLCLTAAYAVLALIYLMVRSDWKD